LFSTISALTHVPVGAPDRGASFPSGRLMHEWESAVLPITCLVLAFTQRHEIHTAPRVPFVWVPRWAPGGRFFYVFLFFKTVQCAPKHDVLFASGPVPYPFVPSPLLSAGPFSFFPVVHTRISGEAQRVPFFPAG